MGNKSSRTSRKLKVNLDDQLFTYILLPLVFIHY